MINEILQFIKKTLVAKRLSQYDLLFLLQGLSGFKIPCLIASVWGRKSELPPLLRIRRFLSRNSCLYLKIMAEELSLQPDFCHNLIFSLHPSLRNFSADSTLFCTAMKWQKTDSFYSSIIQLLAKQDSRFVANKAIFKKRLHCLTDMRIYASELEYLNQYSADCICYMTYAIDWIRTDKNHLFLSLPQPCSYTTDLLPEAQKNLADLWCHLFFNHQLLVSFWSAVLTNRHHQVAFADFDYLLSVDSSAFLYAQSYIRSSTPPADEVERRFVRAFKLLSTFCPDIDVKSVLQKFLAEQSYVFASLPQNSTLLSALQQQGVVSSISGPLLLTNASEHSYLLDSRRHSNTMLAKKIKQIWWPLVLAIYLLVKYF